ncbi:MAG: methyltransferase domain-containing protein [Candidatus Alcyoniella australis]|nr:methyltransferase domain-containing protein [Candidatus Alcyoniella australis]
MNTIKRLLDKPEFPRSMKYDPLWMLENQMGPNVIWITEWLCEQLSIDKEMRVLDLGCGKAISSIFLAKEFETRVWAADLWISPDNNWRRAANAGVADRICPVRVESHNLPFAAGFFDVVVSLNAYHFFGTDALYLNYLSRFVRKGGLLGIVVPGLTRAIGRDVPEHLTKPQSNGKVFWGPECLSIQTVDWWRELWERSGKVQNVRAELLPNGWQHWRDFEQAMEQAGVNAFPVNVEVLDRDQGRYLGLVSVTAQRNETDTMNLYDPVAVNRGTPY